MGPRGWLIGAAGPAALYFALFSLYTFPAVLDFSSRFLTDSGDGLQNVWNLWWVDRALRAGENPWFTRQLHYPHGTSLVPHTLVPFAGLIGSPLRSALSLVEIHNAILIFSFVMGGLTAFWLSLALTRRTAGSLISGAIFTFSSFHFAHAEGHLQLVSLEWIPLFLLAWHAWLARPATLRAIAAAAALLLVLLCDYYYFFFSVLIAAVWFVFEFVGAERPQRATLARGFGVFLLAALACCGPLVYALLELSVRDPLLGAHDPELFSLDLLAPLIPGYHWRFHEWTEFFWARLPGNPHEHGAHWGLSAVVLAVAGWRARDSLACREHRLLVGLLVGFTALALGPKIRIFGLAPRGTPGPFAALEAIFPPLRIAGCPVRMTVITYLALGILAGLGFDALWTSSTSKRAWAAVLIALLGLEYWPRPLPETDPSVPEIVTALKSLPDHQGLIDVEHAIPTTLALYYQTVHGVPMTGGYVARIPTSVRERDAAIEALAAAKAWRRLCEKHGVRYLLFREGRGPGRSLRGAEPILQASGFRVFDAGARWSCRAPS